jgi:hypothetical protein
MKKLVMESKNRTVEAVLDDGRYVVVTVCVWGYVTAAAVVRSTTGVVYVLLGLFCVQLLNNKQQQ